MRNENKQLLALVLFLAAMTGGFTSTKAFGEDTASEAELREAAKAPDVQAELEADD